MKRPSIALCCILKNEVRNLPRLLASVAGCFDEIHLTDTGSTDGSIEWIKAFQGANPDTFLHHFEWCDDFSKARQYSFSHPKTDYLMWLDLDDVLAEPEAFVRWRNEVMKLADFWLATYHYASNAAGKPVCSFARERVVRRAHGFQWKYFVHEGLMPESVTKKETVMQYATTWNVVHKRGPEDMLADRSRNIRMFEKHRATMDARMRYYYGKELFENGKPLEAFGELVNAITEEKLELHDRVMGIQYACMAAMQLNQFERAISLAHQGLALSPQRAEFHIVIADSWLKQNRAADAIPFYEAARKCGYASGPTQGPIFQHEDFYRHYPVNQLAKIFANGGDLDRAEKYVREAEALGPNDDTKLVRKELDHVQSCVSGSGKPREKTDDILISCPPHALYEWDHKAYKEKGIGGSETAAVEMATHLSEMTGRRVLIFNPRGGTDVFGGVEYRSAKLLPEYLRDYEPAVHIGWRHSMKLSEDPMHVWCHDLATQHMFQTQNYAKVMALSPFHKGYVRNFFGLPDDKVMVTRNGIDPARFAVRGDKEPGKIIYSSSPDRGLDRAMYVMDEVVRTHPEAKLHVYYGFENMKKMGMQAQHDALQKMMSDRSYVVYHGNVTQKELTREMMTACVWLYPTNFLETYCITAIEALCCGVYPVVRNWGGLADTLATAHAAGMCDMLEEAGETPDECKAYANAVSAALAERKWERVRVDPTQFSWKSVAREWIEYFGLGEKECRPSNSMPAPMALR